MSMNCCTPSPAANAPLTKASLFGYRKLGASLWFRARKPNSSQRIGAFYEAVHLTGKQGNVDAQKAFFYKLGEFRDSNEYDQLNNGQKIAFEDGMGRIALNLGQLENEFETVYALKEDVDNFLYMSEEMQNLIRTTQEASIEFPGTHYPDHPISEFDKIFISLRTGTRQTNLKNLLAFIDESDQYDNFTPQQKAVIETALGEIALALVDQGNFKASVYLKERLDENEFPNMSKVVRNSIINQKTLKNLFTAIPGIKHHAFGTLASYESIQKFCTAIRYTGQKTNEGMILSHINNLTHFKNHWGSKFTREQHDIVAAESTRLNQSLVQYGGGKRVSDLDQETPKPRVVSIESQV